MTTFLAILSLILPTLSAAWEHPCTTEPQGEICKAWNTTCGLDKESNSCEEWNEKHSGLPFYVQLRAANAAEEQAQANATKPLSKQEKPDETKKCVKNAKDLGQTEFLAVKKKLDDFGGISKLEGRWQMSAIASTLSGQSASVILSSDQGRFSGKIIRSAGGKQKLNDSEKSDIAFCLKADRLEIWMVQGASGEMKPAVALSSSGVEGSIVITPLSGENAGRAIPFEKTKTSFGAGGGGASNGRK